MIEERLCRYLHIAKDHIMCYIDKADLLLLVLHPLSFMHEQMTVLYIHYMGLCILLGWNSYTKQNESTVRTVCPQLLLRSGMV